MYGLLTYLWLIFYGKCNYINISYMDAMGIVEHKIRVFGFPNFRVQNFPAPSTDFQIRIWGNAWRFSSILTFLTRRTRLRSRRSRTKIRNMYASGKLTWRLLEDPHFPRGNTSSNWPMFQPAYVSLPECITIIHLKNELIHWSSAKLPRRNSTYTP